MSAADSRDGIRDWASEFRFSGAYETFARVSELFLGQPETMAHDDMLDQLTLGFIAKVVGRDCLKYTNLNEQPYVYTVLEQDSPGSFVKGENYKRLKEILDDTAPPESKKPQILALLYSKTGGWGPKSFKPHLLVALGADFSPIESNSGHDREAHAKIFMREADVFSPPRMAVDVGRFAGERDLDGLAGGATAGAASTPFAAAATVPTKPVGPIVAPPGVSVESEGPVSTPFAAAANVSIKPVGPEVAPSTQAYVDVYGARSPDSGIS